VVEEGDPRFGYLSDADLPESFRSAKVLAALDLTYQEDEDLRSQIDGQIRQGRSEGSHVEAACRFCEGSGLVLGWTDLPVDVSRELMMTYIEDEDVRALIDAQVGESDDE
jgi:hypothetical protein